MTQTFFGASIPGFEFLKDLAKNATSIVPGMGQWVAPTLSVEELDKRIQELKTVQFWLDQNTRALATTIQAMEVQRMSLATLEAMNVNFADVAEAMKIKTPTPEAEPPAQAAPHAQAEEASKDCAASPAIDPAQWWGALTEQFSTIAEGAMKGMAAHAAQASQAAQAAHAAQTPPRQRSQARKAAPAKTAAKKTTRATAKKTSKSTRTPTAKKS